MYELADISIFNEIAETGRTPDAEVVDVEYTEPAGPTIPAKEKFRWWGADRSRIRAATKSWKKSCKKIDKLFDGALNEAKYVFDIILSEEHPDLVPYAVPYCDEVIKDCELLKTRLNDMVSILASARNAAHENWKVVTRQRNGGGIWGRFRNWIDGV